MTVTLLISNIQFLYLSSIKYFYLILLNYNFTYSTKCIILYDSFPCYH